MYLRFPQFTIVNAVEGDMSVPSSTYSMHQIIPHASVTLAEHGLSVGIVKLLIPPAALTFGLRATTRTFLTFTHASQESILTQLSD